jgi:type I site-specific restriction endonuclease
MPLSEADTSRKFIIPRLQAAGWDNDPHSIAEQRSITDGRIMPTGNPNSKNDLVHREPEELVASILDKEQRTVEIVGRIRALLEKPR